MANTLFILGQVQFDGNFFQQLPTHAKIIIAVVTALAILAVALKYGFDAFNVIKKKNKRGKVDADSLKNHSFFTKCESWSKYKVNELYFGDDVRNRLFRAIISTKIEVMRSKAQEAIGNLEANDMSKKAFETYVFRFIMDSRAETQNRIRERITQMYPDCGIAIYELVMNHEHKGFNAFNQITDNYTERLVQIICESDMYQNNYEKGEMILDALKAALGAAFPHIEASFKGFNGELDEIIKNR